MYSMNQAYAAADPSAQVPNQLLPHVHLVSCYRFPTLPSLQPAHAVDYLTKGPSIVKDAAAVVWSYFAAPPPDGTVILTWQPPRLGTHFASDGLVWADAETVYDMSVRGYQLQILAHKSGYNYPHEPFATHARYRYRITNGPGPFDPNLWIVHYAMAEPALRIPTNQIPITRDVQAQLTMRAQLASAGPLMRKEFMLHDSANWPKVEFGHAAARVQQPYYNPMQPGRPPYVAQQPPAKRQRVQQQARPPVAGAIAADPSLEEEENATQDSFDFMTPREISMSRFKQHHEWMEEIFSSAYSTGHIKFIDLGLGLMGELEPLTAGILDAPLGDNQETNSKYEVKNYNKLQPEQLKVFDTRVSAYVTKEKAEIAKMEAAHAKKMADLKRSRTYIKAERRLREVPQTTYSDAEDAADPLDIVVHDLEKSLGVTFGEKKSVVCVDKGGFIEAQQPQPQTAQVNGNGTTPSNTNGGSSGLGQEGLIDGENTAASLLDQYGSGSLTGTPGANLSVPQLSQPPSQSQSAVATPSAPAGDATQGSSFDEQAANLDHTGGADDLLDLDVEMSGMADTDGKGGDTDWVMVENQGSGSAQQAGANNVQPATSTDAPADQNTIPVTGVDAEGTSMFDTADFGSFDNLDTAGDALADYTNVDDDTMGLDLVDDSAFGDAFHGTEMHHDQTGDGDNV